MASADNQAGQARRPRVAMQVNGMLVTGLVALEWGSTDNYGGDTWRAEVALDGTSQGYGAPWWADQDGITVQFLAAMDANGTLAPLIGGTIDSVDITMGRQAMVLAGRDLTSRMTDRKLSQRFVNQTSSAIVTQLAQAAGLTPQVTATSKVVGVTTKDETAYVTDDETPWAIAADLAKREGFDLYVTGQNLVFAPAAADPNPFVVRYAYSDQTGGTVNGNVAELRMRHNKTLAGGVQVHVRNWHYQTKAPFSAKWQYGSGGANLPVYRERHSGLTQDDADQQAQRRLADIVAHEREVNIEMPGVLDLDVRRTLRLTGTGTAFDQDYKIVDINRAMSLRRGFTMNVRAHAASPGQMMRVSP